MEIALLSLKIDSQTRNHPIQAKERVCGWGAGRLNPSVAAEFTWVAWYTFRFPGLDIQDPNPQGMEPGHLYVSKFTTVTV